MPSADELYHAYVDHPWHPVMRSSGGGPNFRPLNVLNAAVTAFALVLIIFFATIRPEPASVTASGLNARVVRKALHLLLPGAWDLRHGSPLRGTAIAVLTGFAGWLAVAWWKAIPVMHSPGILTATQLPNVKTSLAFPPEDSAIDMLFAPIYARQFWAIAAIAVVALVILHLSRVPSILRLEKARPFAEPPITMTSTPE
jgi:hypothetical protein